MVVTGMRSNGFGSAAEAENAPLVLVQSETIVEQWLSVDGIVRNALETPEYERYMFEVTLNDKVIDRVQFVCRAR